MLSAVAGGLLVIETIFLDAFRNFLGGWMMHGGVVAALCGVCTLLSEPKSLLITDEAGRNFMAFFMKIVLMACRIRLCLVRQAFSG